MATTSANYKHGNTISHHGNNICHKEKNNSNNGTPFGTTDDQKCQYQQPQKQWQ